jgi:maleylacetoacetate isomerase
VLKLKLYSFWRSSCSYRVRIALAYKGLAYEYVPVHLTRDGGEQHQPAFRALNPQGYVPFLVDGDFGLSQSLAILDYLEQRFPDPALEPRDAQARARMWAFCLAIAADIQPLQNTGPVTYLTQTLAHTEEQKAAWIRHWIARGLAALEAGAGAGPYVMGAAVTLADACLVPQWYNADRWQVDTVPFPKLAAIVARCRAHPAFAAASPERQPDAPAPA